MIKYISRSQFTHISENLLTEILNEEQSQTIDLKNFVLRLFDGKYELTYKELLNNNTEFSPIRRALLKRVVLVDYALWKFRENETINTNFVWRLIFETLLFFKKDDFIASVGSQGFLSIELYRYESPTNDRKILRLHIWDNSFTKEFEKTHSKKHIIHSHLFNAQSHILSGTIRNKRYNISESKNKTDLSLYKINWKKSSKTDDKYKRRSNLEEFEKNISINEISTEEVHASQNYSISIDEFHSSESLNSDTPTATIFLFDSSKGKSEFSKVVGPKNDKNPDFSYSDINILPLLYQIDQQIKKQNNKQKLLALDWMRKTHTLEHAHRIESRQLKNLGSILTFAIIIIPAFIVGTTVYVKFSSPETLKDSYLTIVAICAGLSAVFGTINRIIQPGNLSEQHRLNSERFEQLRHKLESHIVFHNDDRLEKLLEEVRIEWNRLNLLNVNERNINKAREMIRRLGKYPENLGFLDDYIP